VPRQRPVPPSGKIPLVTEHRVHRYSHIARPLEPGYPTNRAVLVLAPLVGVGLAIADALLMGSGAGQAAITGALGVVAAFLGWALARELAPDHEGAAFLALALAPLGLLLGQAALLAAAATLFLVRIVNRSVGPPARTGDRALTVLAVAAAVWIDGAWALGFAAAIAFLLDAALPAPDRSGVVFALVGGAIGAAGLGLHAADPLLILAARPDFLLIAGAISAAALIVAATTPAPASRGDIDGEPLTRARVAAGVLVGIAAAWAVAVSRPDGLVAGAAIWAALAAAVEARVMPRRKL